MLGYSTIPANRGWHNYTSRLICDEFYGTTPEHGYGYGPGRRSRTIGSLVCHGCRGFIRRTGRNQHHPFLTKLAVLNSAKSRLNLIPGTIPVKHSWLKQKITLPIIIRAVRDTQRATVRRLLVLSSGNYKRRTLETTNGLYPKYPLGDCIHAPFQITKQKSPSFKLGLFYILKTIILLPKRLRCSINLQHNG